MRNIFMLLFVICSTSCCSESFEKLTILGAGPAGLTAAIYAGQAGLSPLVVETNSCDGQLKTAPWIENFPGFSDGISGEELASRMHLQAEKFGSHFCSGTLIQVDLLQRPFMLTFDDGHTVYSEALIIAVGTAKRWLDIPTEEALKEKGVYSSTQCATASFINKNVAVLGSGDSAAEEALVLAKEASRVTIIHRGEKLSASSYLLDRITTHPHIQILYNMVVDDILDISQDKVTALSLRNLKTEETSLLPCEAVFVSLGRKSNTDLFKGQLATTAAGQLTLTGTETSIPGVFAAGDVHDTSYRKAITAAGFGCMAAIDAIRFLTIQSKE